MPREPQDAEQPARRQVGHPGEREQQAKDGAALSDERVLHPQRAARTQEVRRVGRRAVRPPTARRRAQAAGHGAGMVGRRQRQGHVDGREEDVNRLNCRQTDQAASCVHRWAIETPPSDDASRPHVAAVSSSHLPPLQGFRIFTQRIIFICATTIPRLVNQGNTK